MCLCVYVCEKERDKGSDRITCLSGGTPCFLSTTRLEEFVSFLTRTSCFFLITKMNGICKACVCVCARVWVRHNFHDYLFELLNLCC